MLAVTEIPEWFVLLVPTIVIGIMVQVGWSTVMTLMLRTLARRDTVGDAVEKRLHKAESDLHDTNVKLVDERIRHWTHDVAGDMQRLTTTIDATIEDFKTRLNDGDETFDAINDKRQQLELSIVGQIGELKLWMVEQFVTKAQMDKRWEGVDRKLIEAKR